MSNSSDFMRLADDHVSNCLDPDDQRRLADVIEADPTARQVLADQIVLDRVLRRAPRPDEPPSIDVEKIMRAVLRSELPTKNQGVSSPQAGSKLSASRPSRIIRVLPTRRRSPIHSPWFRSLAAVLVISGVVALTVTSMNRDASDRGVITATLEDGLGTVWGTPPRMPGSNRIAQNTLDLRAGIAAISFATGARVIIEGPAVIELTGPNQAHLLQGRASAYVPPSASGFTLVSEGLTAVDRGTAFGLSRDADKRVQLHVFTGAVDAQASSARTPLLVNAGDAVQRDPHTGSLSSIPCRPTHFYRDLHQREMGLDVADLIAGGDGRGSGIADGIDPRSGELVSSPSIGDILSDGQYHRVKQAPVIDGVFIPRDDQVITSQGHHFTFPPTSGRAYDIIRRGGIKTTYDHPIKQIPAIFDGIDYETPDHAAIGMHANCGFTIDLVALARNHPGMFAERLTARVANFKEELPNQCFADFWVIIDGIMVKRFRDMTPRKIAETIDVPLPMGSRFLTLVSTDSNNDNHLDCVNMGDPVLYLRALP